MSQSIGHSHDRRDARLKVTGQAVYGSDLEVPGMLFGKILRSPVAHARLQGVDRSAALDLPGVQAVVVGSDLDTIDPYYGVALKDQPILAIDTIRYSGEPVAAVVANDLETVETALELIDLEYQELPSAHTLESALAPDAPLVHESFRTSGHFRDLKSINPISGTNICNHFSFEQGDIEAGFAEADRIFEDVYQVPAVHHYPMESYSLIAKLDHDGITVWSGTQHPFLVRKELAEIFGLPQAQVRVNVPLIGGAYGCRCYTKLEPLAVCLARSVDRPVKLVTSVEETFLTLSRHGARVTLKTGVRKDGRILARQVAIHLNTGAYADVGPRVAKKAGFRSIGPYAVPNVKIDSYAVYTNNVPAGAYRGYGAPQGLWATESQMDDMADWLKMDPLAFRLKNLRKRGGEYAPGDTPVDGDMSIGLKSAAEAIDWGGEISQPDLGKGLACGIKDGGGTHTVSVASVRVHGDGSVSLQTGSAEFGQGAHTVLAQIVAEELGVFLENVVIEALSTAVTPYDQGTSASRTTTLMGKAVQNAAIHARQQLVAIVTDLWGCSPQEVTLKEGSAVGPESSLELGAVVAHHFGMPGGEIIGVGTCKPAVSEGSLGGAVAFWEIGMGAADLSVDRATGVITLRRYISVADIGKAINPRMAEGQDEGAAMQGLGHALFEALQYDGGQLINGNLVEYRVPIFKDLPETFESILVAEEDGPGPYGSKGIGESGVMPVAPAIGNALFHATGVRFRELPLNPEVVWRALRAR